MRLSRAYIPTQKETPADAVIPSHQLMLRAGLIRPLAAGIYSYLPMGWKIMKKVMGIIREEMDAIGGQELQLPVLNPIEIWDESGRNTDFGEVMFRLKDRKGRFLVMAPTHEEVISDLARKYIRSYKDLPQIWYQIQTKFRDEPRPRSGVIRTRQFIMKDSYTLDVDAEGLDVGYNLHAKAYRNIFSRCDLQFHVVGASSGLMGGSGSQEFMVESEHGDDTLVLCSACDYAGNLEVATSVPEKITDKQKKTERIHTPGKKTIAEVSDFLKLNPNRLMKSLLFIVDEEPVMILIRGDHEINESKLQAHFGATVRQAQADEVKDVCGADAGFVGPIDLKKKIKIYADLALKEHHNLTTGANEVDYHIDGIVLARDVNVTDYIDVRSVVTGETCTQCGGDLRIVQAVELGHIFKLGTKYSESMKVTYLDSKGNEKPLFMGSYGIGVERIIAAAIEQNHDDKGIAWDSVLAPYQVHIIPVNADKKEIIDTAERIYNQLTEKAIDALIDDREVSPGFKFKDADLLGMPLQIIIGDKWLKTKEIEIKQRKSGKVNYLPEDKLADTICTVLKDL